MSPRSQLSSHHPTTQSISENIVAGAGTSYRPGARLLLTEPNNSPELDRLGSQTQQQDFTSFSLSPIPFQTIMSDGTNILLEIRRGKNPRSRPGPILGPWIFASSYLVLTSYHYLTIIKYIYVPSSVCMWTTLMLSSSRVHY